MGLNVADSGDSPLDFGLGHSAYDSILRIVRAGGFELSQHVLRNGEPYQTEGFVLDLGPNGTIRVGYNVDDPLTPQKERYGSKQVKTLLKYLRKNGVDFDNAF